MRSRSQESKAIFLFYGDLVKSHGTAAYLYSFLKYVSHIWKHTEAMFFQVHLPDGDSCLKDLQLPELSEAPLIKLYHYIPRIFWRFYELFYCYLNICKCLFQRLNKGSTTIFVCGEALLPVVLLCRIRGYKSVYVKMGIIEEYKYITNRKAVLKYLIIHQMEKGFLHMFESITVVSEGMRRYLKQKYGISLVRMAVLPCAVDQEAFGYRPDSRMEIRGDLGLEDRIVFVYSGIWAPWQCIRETIDCFKLLRGIDERAFLLVLSPDREIFQKYLSCLDPEDYRVLSVEHSLMDRYLSSADCGFLIRKRSSINRVASPLKFSEYLMCGLPVIIGPEVGEFSSIIQNEGIGAVIDPDQPEGWKDRLLPLLRQVSSNGSSLKNRSGLKNGSSLKNYCYHLAANGFTWEEGAQVLALLKSTQDIGRLKDPIKR